MMFTHSNQFNFSKLNKEESEKGRFYITPDGKKYPSITTVLSILNKEALDEWKRAVGNEEATRVSRMAANRGTRVHLLFEDYLNNKEPHFKSFLDKQTFNSLKPTLDRYVNNIRAQEIHLYSDHFEIAGQVDCIADFNSKLSVIDFKTSSREKYEDEIESYFIQATGYTLMFEQMTGIPIHQIVILITVDFDKPQIFVKKRAKYISRFAEVREQYREKYNV